MTTATGLRVTGLGKRSMSRLASKARQMGMTPAEYIRQLVEDDLELDRIARTTTLAAILGPGQDVDESELDKLVDRAKRRHYQRTHKNHR